ncbi:hypothetical protein POVCU2_0075280 [Plasmodium ovale curtisi]|uniref:Uncharacterized protein n=1 Tax=Plasmodium ovale curtisi TaxID=864141 RepID=A0A1A8WI64_PLAOA|nr:hypothetical protein POVCU1_006890 [Plasmodium ovale curtisi]SBS92623.1 hypothetical protein POVCU2_0075280 [Plasmodium ovale curtisi]
MKVRESRGKQGKAEERRGKNCRAGILVKLIDDTLHQRDTSSIRLQPFEEKCNHNIWGACYILPYISHVSVEIGEKYNVQVEEVRRTR